MTTSMSEIDTAVQLVASGFTEITVTVEITWFLSTATVPSRRP